MWQLGNLDNAHLECLRLLNEALIILDTCDIRVAATHVVQAIEILSCDESPTLSIVGTLQDAAIDTFPTWGVLVDRHLIGQF